MFDEGGVLEIPQGPEGPALPGERPLPPKRLGIAVAYPDYNT